jgi:hypothetical protein
MGSGHSHPGRVPFSDDGRHGTPGDGGSCGVQSEHCQQQGAVVTVLCACCDSSAGFLPGCVAYRMQVFDGAGSVFSGESCRAAGNTEGGVAEFFS